jgi:hypothetical protein
VSEERRERRILHEIIRLFEELLRWFDNEPRLTARIVPLDEEGNPMTTAPVPFALFDNQSVPLGIALSGGTPDTNPTIESVVWSVDQVIAIDQTPPALTATAVATVGTEGTATVTAVLTMSDGSTLTTAPFVIAVTAASSGQPLTATIVAGTPTP